MIDATSALEIERSREIRQLMQRIPRRTSAEIIEANFQNLVELTANELPLLEALKVLGNVIESVNKKIEEIKP